MSEAVKRFRRQLYNNSALVTANELKPSERFILIESYCKGRGRGKSTVAIGMLLGCSDRSVKRKRRAALEKLYEVTHGQGLC